MQKYIPQLSDEIYSDPKNIVEESSLPWKELVKVSRNTNEWIELFSYKISANKQNIFFVIRTGAWDFTVYKYKLNTQELKTLASYTYDSPEKYKVPKIDKISDDGKYTAFAMFGCWNCGGHAPEEVLMNTETRKTKNIGKVLNFNWQENGRYSYKEYIKIPCKEPVPGDCTEDANKLPLKTEVFN